MTVSTRLVDCTDQRQAGPWHRCTLRPPSASVSRRQTRRETTAALARTGESVVGSETDVNACRVMLKESDGAATEAPSNASQNIASRGALRPRRARSVASRAAARSTGSASAAHASNSSRASAASAAAASSGDSGVDEGAIVQRSGIKEDDDVLRSAHCIWLPSVYNTTRDRPFRSRAGLATRAVAQQPPKPARMVRGWPRRMHADSLAGRLALGSSLALACWAVEGWLGGARWAARSGWSVRAGGGGIGRRRICSPAPLSSPLVPSSYGTVA